MPEKTVKAKSAVSKPGGYGLASNSQSHKPGGYGLASNSQSHKTKTVKKAKPEKSGKATPAKAKAVKPDGYGAASDSRSHKPTKAVSVVKKTAAVRKPRVKKESIAVSAVKSVMKEERPAGHKAVVGPPIAQATGHPAVGGAIAQAEAVIPVKIEPVKEPPPAQLKVIPEVKEVKIEPQIKEPAAVKEAVPVAQEKVVEIDIPVMLKDLAFALGEKPAGIIKKLLIEHKLLANINFPVSEELAIKIASGYGYKIKRKPTEEELLFKEHEADDPLKLKARPPIVTFMGHVDHGKTSLLDAIRKSTVADTEYGGITQHIGAYSVSLAHGKITFLDTPGHEAFTAMRARGAKVTDIVVLVVAADDGVMPQTVEAIDHAKDARAAIIVAMNKIDKPQTNVDMLKKQLSELGLASEDWGGKTITVGVSAKTGQGIDGLLEMILLEAEMLELKADPLKPASGVVLEAKVSEGRGPVATLLVENGTLRVQDVIIAGPHCAKVRAMFNEYGKPVREAPPSTPVEVLGLSGLPDAGEQFFALSDEKKARVLAAKRKAELRERELKPIKMMSLEDLSNQIKEGQVKELKLILKADVGGSLQAIIESLKKLSSEEVKLNIIHQGIGSINVSDVILAEASGAIIMGFHVDTDERSKSEADKTGVDIRIYNVIYELINDLKTALEGLLSPKLKKVFLGRVVVRQVFKLSKAGHIAGCYVEKGKITRTSKVSLLRNGAVVYEGALQSLKRFKDDVREVSEGMECGVALSGFSETMAGDVIEAYDVEKIARKL